MIEPFLKWPGGKRWLVSRHSHLLPNAVNRFIEPFLGSGAVFFSLSAGHSILSDANSELIATYSSVARYPKQIEALLEAYQASHSTTFFYEMRKAKPRSAVDKAARFIYLNRTCFNGMYRVNREGHFNVPIGTKQTVSFQKDYLLTVAERLAQATLYTCDFEVTLKTAKEGDFVFVDPPYTVTHNNNGFIKYNSSLFSWADQIRLAAAVRQAAQRGASILLTNADHSDVRDLYANFGKHHSVKRASILSGDPSARRQTTELVVTSYR